MQATTSPVNDTNDLEAIARKGSRWKRMAVRIPTYIADVKENPAWLPMFVLARTLPGRRAHWLTARRYRTPVTCPPVDIR